MKANILKLNIVMANNCFNTKDLQKITKMPRPTINNVISGRSVRPATLGRVAKALNVDVRDIMEFEEG